MKAFACLISLHTNCQDCEASKDHLAMYTLTHIHPLLIMCPDPRKCAIAAISELEKGYYYDAQERFLNSDHILSCLPCNIK